MTAEWQNKKFYAARLHFGESMAHHIAEDLCEIRTDDKFDTTTKQRSEAK